MDAQARQATCTDGSDPERTPAGRAPRLVVDLFAGAGVALTLAMVVATEESSTGSPPEWAAYLFALGFGVLMPMRRRAPRAVVVVTVFGLFAYYAMEYPPVGVAVPVVAVLFTAAEAGLPGWAVGAGAVVLTVSASFRLR